MTELLRQPSLRCQGGEPLATPHWPEGLPRRSPERTSDRQKSWSSTEYRPDYIVAGCCSFSPARNLLESRQACLRVYIFSQPLTSVRHKYHSLQRSTPVPSRSIRTISSTIIMSESPPPPPSWSITSMANNAVHFLRLPVLASSGLAVVASGLLYFKQKFVLPQPPAPGV